MKTATIMSYSWKEYLLRKARLNSMCLEQLDALRGCETKDEAVNLYKKTIDWALERNYPPVNFIRNEFGNCEDLGIFIDKDFHGELLDEHQCYVFHNCRGTIMVEMNTSEKIIPMLYFANGCDITVKRSSEPHTLPIKVPLYIFGDNTVIANDCDDIVFRIYRKGGAK